MMQGSNFITTYAKVPIKNMVSESCVKIVKQELQRTGFINVVEVKIGEAEFYYDAQVVNLDIINTILERNGFKIIKDNNKLLVEKIKSAVIAHIFYGANTNSLLRNSDYLSEQLELPYATLSKVFSTVTGSTLEKYIILIKIEKIKELITYDEHSLSEISFMMGYSSVHYLSNQFKQVTGYTVSQYKKEGISDRKSLNSLI
jgi:AraC family transcriptional regulator